MAEYIEPKTSWDANEAPLPSDMIRIENNEIALHDMILAEAVARLNADNAEETARISGDASTLTSAISGNSSFYIENRTSDPASAPVGHMWLRIDL